MEMTEAAHAANMKSVCAHHVIIPSRLSVAIGRLEDISNLYQHEILQGAARLVTTDLHRRYRPFALDFGPVNLGVVYRFCRVMQKHIETTDTLLVYCVESRQAASANACFLLGSFLILKCGFTSEQAADSFPSTSFQSALLPFRDASRFPSNHDLHLKDCLASLSKAVHNRWFILQDFNLDLFETLENPVNGHIHHINFKFVAFKGPLDTSYKMRAKREIALPPEHYIPIFRRMDVTCIVRLNDTDTYDSSQFEAAGFQHCDLYFDDGTTPTSEIVQRFLGICERQRKIAIHCRAGLGRTGTLIAVWLIQKAGFTANEAIAWLRIVRPGSVIGSQQLFLKRLEDALLNPTISSLSCHTPVSRNEGLHSEAVNTDFFGDPKSHDRGEVATKPLVNTNSNDHNDSLQREVEPETPSPASAFANRTAVTELLSGTRKLCVVRCNNRHEHANLKPSRDGNFGMDNRSNNDMRPRNCNGDTNCDSNHAPWTGSLDSGWHRARPSRLGVLSLWTRARGRTTSRLLDRFGQAEQPHDQQVPRQQGALHRADNHQAGHTASRSDSISTHRTGNMNSNSISLLSRPGSCSGSRGLQVGAVSLLHPTTRTLRPVRTRQAPFPVRCDTGLALTKVPFQV